MKEKKKNTLGNYLNIEKIYFAALLFFFVCLIVYQDFIFENKIFLFKDIGSDTINIVFPWIIGTADYVENGSEIGWSFSQGMGQNIFPFFYSDLFHLAVSLFEKPFIPYLLVYLQIIKVFLAGFVFYKFLKEVKLSGYSSLVFSLLYAFSGFIILGGCWTIFSTEALYAAIILYGFERWLNHQKFTWFVIGIVLMAFLQPFFLFMYTILLAAYAIVRYNDVKEKNTKAFIFFVLKTIGLAALAVFITSYQLFATLLQYAESPRVGGEASLFARLQGQPMFAFADDILRFSTVFRSFGSDMIGTGNGFKGWQNYLESPLFYCGIFCLVTFPQFFSSLNTRQKYFYGIITTLFCLPMVFPYFRYLFWAFSGDYFRTYSLVVILFLLMYSARAINYIEQKSKLNKIVLGATVICLLYLLYTPSVQFKPLINNGLRTFVTFLIIAYAILLIGISQKTAIKNASKICLLVLCIVEVAFLSNITVNKRDVITKYNLSDKVGYNDYTVDAVNYLKQTDKSFYRINKDYNSGLAMHSSMNDAKVQGYYSTASYFSFNQKNYIKFLGDLNVIDAKNEYATRWAKGLGERPILFSIASGKYWLSKQKNSGISRMGFDSINQFGDVTVYKNRYVLPLGYTYDKVIGENEFKKLSSMQKDVCLLQASVIDNEDKAVLNQFKSYSMTDTLTPLTFDNYLSYVNDRKKDNFLITKFSENNIIGTINTAESKLLFFSIPFDEGWKVTVNGKETKLYRVNCGLTGLLTQKGNNVVELSFTPRYKKEGTIVSSISLLAFIGLLFFNNRRNKKS